MQACDFVYMCDDVRIMRELAPEHQTHKFVYMWPRANAYAYGLPAQNPACVCMRADDTHQNTHTHTSIYTQIR